MNFSDTSIIVKTGEIIALGALIWKLARLYGRLEKSDEQNKRDLKNLGDKIRTVDYLNRQRLNHMEDFLVDKTNYVPPSIGLIEENHQQ